MSAVKKIVIGDDPPVFADFLAAVGEANAVLNGQRAALERLGRPAQVSPAAAEFAGLLGNLRTASEPQRMRLLSLALAEIRVRQVRIDEALQEQAYETVALDAFAHAMHRIRSSLDVALGCVEDIADVACERPDDGDIQASARQAARALRLTYHFSLELNDLASLRDTIADARIALFPCSEVVDDIIDRVSRVALDTGVTLTYDRFAEPLLVNASRDLLDRAVACLLMISVVSLGVTRIHCAVRQVEDAGVACVDVAISDNGRGQSLESRAQTSSTLGLVDLKSEVALGDAAGFAIARRLAVALGGRLTLERAEGRGSRSRLIIPLASAPASQV